MSQRLPPDLERDVFVTKHVAEPGRSLARVWWTFRVGGGPESRPIYEDNEQGMRDTVRQAADVNGGRPIWLEDGFGGWKPFKL